MKVYNWIVPIRLEMAETIAATLARAGVDFQMERLESGYAVGLTERGTYELFVSLKHFDPATEVFEGQQYVVVNTSIPKDWSANHWDKYPGEFNVMPGEEPHTYGLLKNAADCLADLMDEYDHTLKTAPIFQLIPVPLDWVEAALKLVKEDDNGDE